MLASKPCLARGFLFFFFFFFFSSHSSFPFRARSLIYVCYNDALDFFSLSHSSLFFSQIRPIQILLIYERVL